LILEPPQATSKSRDAARNAGAESLLETFKSAPLLDAYDIFQHLMDYWAETMQDDCYLLAADGRVAMSALRQ
jgi:hypothetical protein